jgi:exosortase K
MTRRVVSFRHIAQLLVVLLAAVTLKQYYSTANVNELRWVLAPTASLVQMITGERFTFEPFAGYMSADHSFLIAQSCSGVNFLISAFLLLALSKLWRCRHQKIGWVFIPFAAAASYISTIVANTARIATALHLRKMDTDWIWLNPDQLHRFEGIVVYFGCLMLLLAASQRLGSEPQSRERSLTSLLRRAIPPLAIYYVITLGVPVVTSLYRGRTFEGFWEHSLFVILTPLVILLPMIAFRAIRDHRLFRSESPVLHERY